jgi:hypothetical protein
MERSLLARTLNPSGFHTVLAPELHAADDDLRWALLPDVLDQIPRLRTQHHHVRHQLQIQPHTIRMALISPRQGYTVRMAAPVGPFKHKRTRNWAPG